MEQLTTDTLVADVYALFDNGHTCDPSRTEQLGHTIAAIVAQRLESYKPTDEKRSNLRVSNLGKGDRQLWYQEHRPDIGDNLSPPTKIKFLFGDIWEAIMLHLAAEAGHKVEQEQAEVSVAGVLGHIDAIIDGVVVDCKSASPFAFQKFKKGTIREDDAFGYMEQLAGYSKALGGIDAGFFAADKVSGELAFLPIPAAELEPLQIEERAESLRAILESDETPDRCHSPKPHGESGNESLAINCSYCPFKFECWKDANDGKGLRTFLYSGGPVHFTKIVKEPKVLEITF